ncbi:hypothetical protein HAX54_034246, partial [Datura stramonium]|nr:hypothetical protein [Datura stramonium]
EAEDVSGFQIPRSGMTCGKRLGLARSPRVMVRLGVCKLVPRTYKRSFNMVLSYLEATDLTPRPVAKVSKPRSHTYMPFARIKGSSLLESVSIVTVGTCRRHRY